MKKYPIKLLICAGTGCVGSKSFEIKTELEKEISKKKLKNKVTVVTMGCQGFCAQGPIVTVQPDNIFYHKIRAKDVPVVVEEHLLKGRPVTNLMYLPPKKKPTIPRMMDIGFSNTND